MINENSLSKSHLSIRLHIFLLRGLFQLLERISPWLASRLALKVFLTPPRTKASRLENKFEQQGASEYVCLGNKQLRILRHGSGGRTVLLVHGWGSRATHLGGYDSALMQAGYCVYSLDGPAHGESTGVATDMMEFSETIALIVDHLHGIDAVVGHSFGAACTLLAIDRFGMKVKQLVLISCFADAIFITEIFARFFRIGQSVIRDMRALLERRYQDAWQWENIAPRLLIRNLDNPILLIHDLYDDEVPFVHAQTLHSSNAKTQLFSTRMQGHRKILRDKKGINAAVAFLSETAPNP